MLVDPLSSLVNKDLNFSNTLQQKIAVCKQKTADFKNYEKFESKK